MAAAHPNSFKARKTLKVGSRSYTYFSLKAVENDLRVELVSGQSGMSQLSQAQAYETEMTS